MSQISDLENRYSLFEQGLLDEAQGNQLRQDLADAASARDIDLFEDQRTDSGQLYESGKAAARGFLGSFATMGEGLGEAADAITNKLGFEDLIDSGEENELVRISRAAQESIQEKLSADVEYRDQWLTKFGEGAGSFASFFVPGGALKLVGAGSKIAGGTAAVQAAGVGAGEQAQRIQGARDQGIDVSQGQEDSSILWGLGVGLTELAPIHRILSRITKSASPAFKAGIAAKIKGALVSGGIEGIQEVAASIMQDAIERGIYNEELPFNGSLMDDFTVGGAVGAVADLALNAAGRRSGRKRNRKAEQDLRTAEQDAVEGLAGEVTEGQIQERAGAETALPDFVVEDDATPDDLIDFQKTLDQEMKGAGLSDVKANIHHALRNVLRNNDGNLVFGIRPRREGEQDVRTFGGQSNIVVEEGPKTEEGVALEGLFSDAANQIFVAADSLPKDGTVDQQRDAAVGVLRHEQLHAMRAMDLFTDSEWTTLTKAVNQRNKKGTDGTYFDWASNSYENLSPVELVEEAVAEMTRDLRSDKTIVTGKPRTLIQRIIDFFPKLNNFVKGRGYTTFDSLVRDIDSGKVGGRKRGEIRTFKNLEGLGSVVRQPDFDVSGTINQEREDDFVDKANTPKDKYSIRNLYHGSGQDFDEFSSDSIGSGEGMQSMGRGLYFAESKATAQSYRDALGKDLDITTPTGDTYTVLPSYIQSNKFRSPKGYDEYSAGQSKDFDQMASNVLRNLQSTNDPRFENLKIREIQSALADINEFDGDIPALREAIQYSKIQGLEEDLTPGIEAILDSLDVRKGRMYKVDLDSEQESFLDLDVKLEEQPEVFAKIKKASWWKKVEAAAENKASQRGDISVGLDVLRLLESATSPEVAQQELSKLGIAGTKFYDAFSRHKRKGKKTSNYVVFDDSTVSIKDKFSKKRSVGAPKTGVRPEIANAYKRLTEGTITRKEYDTVVLGTLGEYGFVPDPATYEQMYGALDSSKNKKINLPVEDGADVGLRLDILAYTKNGVWVPTIHQSVKGGSPKTSHRATAAITNVDFTKSSQVAAERIMEGRIPETEGYLKREKIIEEITPKIEEINRSNMTSEEKNKAKSKLTSKLSPFDKTPFAQVRGSFVNRTDAQNEAIAQEALDSPDWIQVGFDPRRHSYFYDRKTGEPVTFADEVVQVGPLVLAKNATKNTLADGSKFNTKFSRRVEDAEGQRGDRDGGRSRADREVAPLAGSPDVEGKGQSKKLSGSQNPTQREKEFLTSDNQNTSR